MLHRTATLHSPLLGYCPRGEEHACVSVGLAATPPVNHLFTTLYLPYSLLGGYGFCAFKKTKVCACERDISLLINHIASAAKAQQ